MTDKLLLVGVIGFALGVLMASYLGSVSLVFFFAFLAVVFFGLWRLRKQAVLIFVCVLLLTASIGAMRMQFVAEALPDEFVPLVGTEVEIEGVVVADPDIRETSQRITVEVEKDGVQTRVLAVAPLYPSVRYGERVVARGEFTLPEAFETDMGRQFSYDKFLAKDSVFAVLQNASLEVIAPREGFVAHVFGPLADFKNIGIEMLGHALPEPHASLASGLILGGKQGLGEDLLDSFIVSGLVHIVVLSGYNVMIVAEFVLRLLGFLPKRTAAWFGVATIAAFVLAAGAGAASVRAGLMAGIAVFGRATGRTYDAFRALLLAGVVMVLASPYSLAYDPGFQLSFIATLGLIFGAPIVERWLHFVKSAFLREIASATIAAQISVLPLLIYQNGLFSLVALPVNLIVLPIVPIAMLASAVAGLGGFIVPALATLIGLPAYLLLSYIISIVEISAALPLAALSIPAFPFIFTILAYAGLIYLVWRSYDASANRFSTTAQLTLSRKAST